VGQETTPQPAPPRRRLAGSAGRGRAVTRSWWYALPVPAAGSRRAIHWRARGLLPTGTAGRIIACGVGGLVLLLALMQLIHLAQLAVTLVSLLVVLRLLGFLTSRW